MTTKKPPKDQPESAPAKAGTRTSRSWKADKSNSVAPANEKMPKKPGRDKKTVKSEEKPAPKPRGNTSTYNDDVAANICDLLAEGIPLRQICRHPDMPAWRTVYAWRDAHPEFDARIARARVAGFDAIAEEALDIADDTANDTILGENGPRANTEWIARSKLRIETRLKLLAKWDPKRYGEKVDLNHGVQPENPLASLMQQLAGKTLKPVGNPEDDE